MVIHCIKAGIVSPTSSKLECLDHEYNGFQWWMQFGIDKDILSQHKGAKGYFYEKEKIKYKDYPLILPHKQIWYRNRETKLTPHWIKISVRKRKGIGVWLPIRPHKSLPDFQYIRDSMLIKNKKGNYEVRLIFDVPQNKINPKNILAVDLGERVIATVCDSVGNKLFLGRDVRGIRRHYDWLRQRLGKKKLLNKIKKIGQREHNIVRNKLHHISKEIVDLAEQNNSVIVVGDLKGIRDSAQNKGKRVRRIVGKMPYFALTRMIEQKAEKKGIQVMKIDESYSSQECHKCGYTDKNNRKTQGLFSCLHCGLQYNADLNGAMNNLNRAGEQDFLAGALAEAQKSLVIAK